MPVETPERDEATKSPSPQAESDKLKAVHAAADKRPEEITGKEAQAATDWFMSDDVEEQAWDYTELNTGGPVGSGRERWVRFKISALPRERITEIREEATVVHSNGQSKTNGVEANTVIAVEGLLEPDLQNAPRPIRVRGQDFMDPADALNARFAHKSGLIDIIANKIVQLSGYDDGDVREVKAAGN